MICLPYKLISTVRGCKTRNLNRLHFVRLTTRMTTSLPLTQTRLTVYRDYIQITVFGRKARLDHEATPSLKPLALRCRGLHTTESSD